jgi:glutaredoxin 3
MSNAVTLFHTSTCPYCTQAERLLARHGVTEVVKLNIGQNVELRDQMVERTGRRTVPQIFIGSQHVGGYDDLLELDRRGDLAPLLKSA